VVIERKITWITLSVVALLALYFFGFNPEFRFTTSTKLIVHPAEEWELIRSFDGNILTVERDYKSNNTKSYSVTEFQRGDAVKFVLNQQIMEREFIRQGDTIGYVYSNEEQRRLIQMIGELAVLKAELAYHTTGQKPEDVLLAERQLLLARQELETQKKLMTRSNELIADQIISKEKYDLDLNELKVKELNVKVAEANLASIDTGEKPEMAKLVESKIKALQNEIDQIQSRIDFLTIISPIDGVISVNHASLLLPPSTSTEKIVRVISTHDPIGLLPVQLAHRAMIPMGTEVIFKKTNHFGKVVGMNNTAQLSFETPFVYCIVQLEDTKGLLNGDVLDVKVKGKKTGFRTLTSFYLFK